MKIIQMQLVCLLMMWAVSAFAQKKAPAPNFQEGIIRYGIEIDGKEAAQARQFINGTTVTLYMKGQDVRFEINAMSGFAKMQYIRNSEQKTNTLLLDIPMFADKIAVSISDEDEMFKKFQEQTPADPNKASNMKFKGKKKIAKHRCKRGIVPVPNAEGSIVLYVTEKIRPFFGEEGFQRLGGFPLGMELDANGMNVKFMASSVEKTSLDAATFAIPEGYEMKTFEEFQEEMKGKIGGGGIGL